MKCRGCYNILSKVFVDLGSTPPSNSFLSRDDLNRPEVYYPLKVMVCEKCLLVQVDEIKKSEHIFNNDYIYFSSYSKSWLEHSRIYSEKMIERLNLNAQSFVVEVASNDGYLLQYFKQKQIPCLGIEPTSSTAQVAREKGIPVVERFFGEICAKELVHEHGKADLMIGNNVLAHVPNIHDFIAGFKQFLKTDGVITLEFPHLMQLIENNQFDTIYHEHFSYLSFAAVCSIFKMHDLRIFDVESLTTHGGSLRIFACHQGSVHKDQPSVIKMKEVEEYHGMSRIEYYQNFQDKVEKIKYDSLRFLLEAKQKKLKVAAYGAAAKGNTLLNFSGIKSDLISFVVDASPYKQGKFLPGSRIPVVDLQHLINFDPDYVIIFPWNIKTEILNLLRPQLKKAKFVIFFPELEIIN